MYVSISRQILPFHGDWAGGSRCRDITAFAKSASVSIRGPTSSEACLDKIAAKKILADSITCDVGGICRTNGTPKCFLHLLPGHNVYSGISPNVPRAGIPLIPSSVQREEGCGYLLLTLCLCIFVQVVTHIQRGGFTEIRNPGGISGAECG